MCCYEPRLAILVSGVAGMLGMFTLLATERPTQEARDAKPCVRCYEPRMVSRASFLKCGVFTDSCAVRVSQTCCNSLACLLSRLACFIVMFLGMFGSRSHVLLACLKACLDMSFACIICISNSTERQTCCKCELLVLRFILNGYLLSVL